MNKKIYRENATKKDRIELPAGMRYANFCKRTLEKEPRFECSSKENEGFLGFYGDSKTAGEAALSHPHPVIIRFFPLHQTSRYDF